MFANLGGSAVAMACQIVLVPLYVAQLGLEGYAIIGLLLTIELLLRIFDTSMSTALNRQIARRSADPLSRSTVRQVVRSFGALYWALAGLFVVGFFVLAAPISHNALKLEAITPDKVSEAIALFGLAAAFRWPAFLYGAVLKGLERHVIYNAAAGGINLLRLCAVSATLFVVPGDVTAAVGALVGTAALEAMTLAYLSWRATRARDFGRPIFSMEVLKGSAGFTAQVGLASLAAAGLKQLDRLFLALLMPITAIAYYSPAVLLTQGLTMISGPIFQSVFPRLTRLFDVGHNSLELGAAYHLATRVLVVLTAPIAATLVWFPGEVLELWTRSSAIAEQGKAPLVLLALAALFNLPMAMPLALLLSSGNSRLPAIVNTASVVVLTPILFVLIKEFGTRGAGATWLAFNIGYFALVPFLVHRRLLVGEATRWYASSVALPMLVALACVSLVALGYRQFSWFGVSPLFMAVGLALAWATSYFTFGDVRDLLLRRVGPAREP